MKDEAKNMWICPKCGRPFKREGQTHSCRVFPLKEHFRGKPRGKVLYEKFKAVLEKRIGDFAVDSPECCIHFVRHSTFVAVKVLKEKIRVDFTLSRFVEHPRLAKFVQFSTNRYLYYVDVKTEDEMDEELLCWVQEAHDIREK